MKFTRHTIFKKKENSPLNTNVPTIVSEGTKIEGNIICEGIVQVDGTVKGDINCQNLFIGEKGFVKGAVNASEVELYGKLKGKVLVGKMFIAKTASLIGDVSHESLAIEPGAHVEGHCRRVNEPIKAEQGKEDLLITDETKSKSKK